MYDIWHTSADVFPAMQSSLGVIDRESSLEDSGKYSNRFFMTLNHKICRSEQTEIAHLELHRVSHAKAMLQEGCFIHSSVGMSSSTFKSFPSPSLV